MSASASTTAESRSRYDTLEHLLREVVNTLRERECCSGDIEPM